MGQLKKVIGVLILLVFSSHFQVSARIEQDS